MDSADHPLRESGISGGLGAVGRDDMTGSAGTGSFPLDLVVTRPLAGVCVVSVSGELDTLTAPTLLDRVRRELAGGASSLVIDLEEVEFLASAGLRALVESSQAVAGAVPGSKLHLSGVDSRAVRRPLEMVGLLPLFTVHPSVGDALITIARASDGSGDADRRRPGGRGGSRV